MHRHVLYLLASVAKERPFSVVLFLLPSITFPFLHYIPVLSRPGALCCLTRVTLFTLALAISSVHNVYCLQTYV